jgi:predicted RNase H-like nuclease
MKTLKDLRVKSKSSNYSLQEKIEEINKFTISKNIKPKVFLEKHPEITKDLFIDTMKKINKPFRNKSPLQQKRIVNRNIPTKKALRGVIDIVMFKSTEESKSSA